MSNLLWCLLVSYLFLLCISHIRCDDEASYIEQNVNDEIDNDSNSEVDEEFVLVLTDENFDETVAKHSTILVEFHAPSCEVCKHLAPHFADAAKELAENEPPVALAMVDASVNSELAKRFEVVGYPTLKFFKNGKDYLYEGAGSKENIVEYMKNIAHPEWIPEPDAVIVLTKDNFYDVVNKETVMLVEFYSPGCDECKKLARVYERAAKELKKDNPPILLAKVDATVETELATKYGITSYPTLKVFRSGRAVTFKSEYNSPYDIMYYMKRQRHQGAREITDAKMFKYLLVPNEISVVGFFDSRDDPKIYPYIDLSIEIRDDFNFGIVFGEELRKTFNVKPNSVVLFTGERYHTKYEPRWYSMEVKDDTTSEDIFDYLRDHHLPLVGQYINPLNNHYDKKRPLCLVFYSVDFSFDHKDATQFWRLKIADVAIQFPDITFAIADDEEHMSKLQQFGLEESGEEINIGLYGADGKKYAMEPMGEFDSDKIVQFLNKYKQGKLKPYIKSQRPPKKQVGPLTVVVGETFEEIVKDSSKDVFIELYSPWSPQCKHLQANLETLAKKLQDSNLVIAKMDATTNDLPENYSAPDYPTVYFATASNKATPLKYVGQWNIEHLENYLRENAEVSFGKSQKEEL